MSTILGNFLPRPLCQQLSNFQLAPNKIVSKTFTQPTKVIIFQIADFYVKNRIMEIAGLQINMMMRGLNRFRIKLLVLLTSERSCPTSIATHRLLHFIIILLIKFILTKNIVASIYLEHPLPMHAIINNNSQTSSNPLPPLFCCHN